MFIDLFTPYYDIIQLLLANAQYIRNVQMLVSVSKEITNRQYNSESQSGQQTVKITSR